jgi:hypothetical protein
MECSPNRLTVCGFVGRVTDNRKQERNNDYDDKAGDHLALRLGVVYTC